MQHGMNVDTAPYPSDGKEPTRAHDAHLASIDGLRDVIALEEILIEGNVAIPGSAANQQLSGKVNVFPEHFFGVDFDFVNDARLVAVTIAAAVAGLGICYWNY
jgi:hypothetical protein